MLSYGPRGSIESLPAGYTSGVIIQAGTGIRHTMRAWGLTLMKNGGKNPDLWKEDFSLRFLGYTTDNASRTFSPRPSFAALAPLPPPPTHTHTHTITLFLRLTATIDTL